MVCNGYYKVMSNSPKMGHLPIPGVVARNFIAESLHVKKPGFLFFFSEFRQLNWGPSSSIFDGQNHGPLVDLFSNPFGYIWINHHDLTVTSVTGMMLARGNYLKMALFFLHLTVTSLEWWWVGVTISRNEPIFSGANDENSRFIPLGIGKSWKDPPFSMGKSTISMVIIPDLPPRQWNHWHLWASLFFCSRRSCTPMTSLICEHFAGAWASWMMETG